MDCSVNRFFMYRVCKDPNIQAKLMLLSMSRTEDNQDTQRLRSYEIQFNLKAA